MMTRRNLLGSSLATGAIATLPGFAFAKAATDKRFVFVIQRGAADGLAILPPIGDPAFTALRGREIADGTQSIGSFFGLHPDLKEVGKMFAAGEARALHAVATAYRDRSHFDGQNVLETGGSRPYKYNTGWLGKLLPLLPPGESSALAFAPAVPLALRGAPSVATYAPNRLPPASDELLTRVSALYLDDRLLGPAWEQALQTRMLAADIGGNSGRNGADLARLAAGMMTPDNGARVVMIETDGWDTHTQQDQRLARQLVGLDGLLGGLKTGLGPAWRDTLVLVATEFGRTAAINGTRGTDHGTASAAFLLGGDLPRGSTVEADWPGLAQSALYEGRDLRPTGNLGSIVTDTLAAHYGLDPARLENLFEA
jgi:uncharacterized protein (DUF1501 family)